MLKINSLITTKAAFLDYVDQGYTHVPLALRLSADLDTALSIYLKLANESNTYLFESVEEGERWGRYSFVGLSCSEWMAVRGEEITHKRNGQLQVSSATEPFAYIEQWRQTFKVPELTSLPVFSGGLVGYFGYESIAYIEPRLKKTDKEDSIKAADIFLMLSDELVAIDNLKDELYIIVHAKTDHPDAYEQALQRLEWIQSKLSMSYQLPQGDYKPVDPTQVQYQFEASDFKKAVERVRDYIYAGDVMQVVLSQRMQLAYDIPALNLYRAIRSINPSPYLFFLKLEDLEVIGASPEILVRLDQDQHLYVRPLAGTRPRGENEAHDQQLEKALLNDEKEIAEHVMLIDLGRNDLGRVSESGSVEVTDQMVIERYSHVMHIVSNIRSKLKKELGPLDALKATFPAGTLSGAPKVRAMEIIDEFENVKRGIYGGAIGYISWQGNLDTAIAIRTAIIKDKILYTQSGAGLVADSDPQSEWQETLNKAQAMLQAAKKSSEF